MTRNASCPYGNASLPESDAPRAEESHGEVLEQVVSEAVRETAERRGQPAATGAAAEFGRRVGEALAREEGAPELIEALGGVDGHADVVLAAVTEGLVRGFAAARARERAPQARPADGGAGRPPVRSARMEDLVTAARRAAHDLNQPLTVILGYAAILRRAGTEGLRVEAAEQIVKEARKMSGIIVTLSRLARGLDAA